MNKKYILAPSKNLFLSHSAKGSTWEKHDYIKVKDGKYYYPDSYKGGRHLPKGDKAQADTKIVNGAAPAGWENKLYSEFEENLKRIGGKLDPKQIQELLMFGKDENGKTYDNFAVALAEHAGINADEIDPAVLNQMRYKVVQHYKEEFEKEKENFDKEGNRIKDRKNKVSKTSSSKKKSTESDKKEKVETKEEKPSKPKSTGRDMHRDLDVRNSSSYWTSSESDKEKRKSKPGYHKADGMENGIIVPPYVIKSVKFKPTHIFRG